MTFMILTFVILTFATIILEPDAISDVGQPHSASRRAPLCDRLNQ